MNPDADNDQPGKTRNDVRAFGVHHNNNPTTHMSYSIMDLTNAHSSMLQSLQQKPEAKVTRNEGITQMGSLGDGP